MRTLAGESGTQGSLGPKTRGPFASVDLNILICKMGPVLGVWVSGPPSCLTSHSRVKNACPSRWRAKWLLPGRGMPVSSPPPGSLPFPSSYTHTHRVGSRVPEAALSPYAWCGFPDPPSGTLSILGFWPPSQPFPPPMLLPTAPPHSPRLPLLLLFLSPPSHIWEALPRILLLVLLSSHCVALPWLDDTDRSHLCIGSPVLFFPLP